jgi:hypothetical protein
VSENFGRGSKKWRASIKYGSKGHHLGAFDDEEDAARAYDSAAKEHLDSDAQLNFPGEGEQDEEDWLTSGHEWIGRRVLRWINGIDVPGRIVR